MSQPITTDFPAAARSRDTASPSHKAIIGARALSTLATLFLLFDIVIKLFATREAVDGTRALGYDPDSLLTLAIIQIVCLALYLVPRTAVFGAILWTGYLGGAVATHFRLGNPLFSHQLFPIYVALLLWGGLWLRDTTLRTLVPLRRDR